MTAKKKQTAEKVKIKSVSEFFFRYRGLIPFLVIPVIFFLRIRYLGGSKLFDELVDLCGLFVALIGEAIRVIAIGYGASGTSSRSKYAKAFQLNTKGLYSLTRNPIYLGNILMAVGIAIIWGNPLFVLICFGLAMTFFYIVILHEEKILDERFSAEYASYKERTPKLFPRFTRYIPGDIKFNWRRVLRKEYDTIFLIFVVCYTVEIYEELIVEHNLTADAWFASGFVLCLFIVWLLIKAWKKKLFD